MFENTPSDRVQLVGLGELLNPAKCMICGTGNCEEGYARLGVWYDYEGEQYLCRLCTIQCAELFGCLTPEEAQHLQNTASELAAKNAAYEEELRIANERLAVFDGIVSGALANGTIPVADVISGVTTAEDSIGSSSGVDEQVTGESDGSESEPAESVKGSDASGTDGPELQHSSGSKPAIPRI